MSRPEPAETCHPVLADLLGISIDAVERWVPTAATIGPTTPVSDRRQDRWHPAKFSISRRVVIYSLQRSVSRPVTGHFTGRGYGTVHFCESENP